MIERTILLEDIVSVAAGKTAIITCPRGPRYKKIILKFGNTALGTTAAPTLASVCELVQLTMAGGIQRRALGVHIDAINALNGANYASQTYVGAANGGGRRHLVLQLEEPWRTRVRPNSVDVASLGWQTGWLPSNKPLQIKVAIPAGVTPDLTAEAIVDDVDEGKPHNIVKVFSDDMPANGASASMTTLHNGIKDGDRFVSISGFDTGDAKTITDARFEVGPVVVYQNININAIITRLRTAGLDPAGANAIANACHLVFDINDSLDDTLPSNLVSSLLKFTLSAAAAQGLPLVSQRFGLPEIS